MRAPTAQLYPGRGTFEFDQRHVTKNQPITMLILLSESLAIQQDCGTSGTTLAHIIHGKPVPKRTVFWSENVFRVGFQYFFKPKHELRHVKWISM